MNFRRIATGLGVVLCLTASTGNAQSADEATRRLWDTAFINSGKAQTLKRRRGTRSYRIATPQVPVTNVAGDTVVGVTVWRLRRSSSSDSGERIIVHEGNDEGEWLPERISGTTKLAEGDRLRITVEAARTGYLYVIDREQYADGSLGEPYLIFPTTRTLKGDNSVKVGKLIEIPSLEDSPPYFRVRRTRQDQIAEVLSVFVTPTPLAEIKITENMQKISAAQVAMWEKEWGGQTGAIELEKGAGRAWTKDEKDASGMNGAILNGRAPAPQTVYYRPSAKASEPMLVRVELRYLGRAK
jgi:hypothetical protein